MRNTYIYPPEPSMRIVSDIIEYHVEMRCRNSTRSRFPATTCKRPAPTWSRNWPIRWPMGKRIRACGGRARHGCGQAFAGRLSFFFAIGMNFFMEAAKAPRGPASSGSRIMTEFGNRRNPNAPRCSAPIARPRRVSLAGAGPLQQRCPHRLRSPVGRSSAARSPCTPIRFDEAIALPTEFSARIARNTQLILQNETGRDQCGRPAGGLLLRGKPHG